MICSVLAALFLVLITPGLAWAQLRQHENENGVAMVEAWKVCGISITSAGRRWPTGKVHRAGRWYARWLSRKTRLDHPVDLQVFAGRREWSLPDITLDNAA